MAPDVLPPEARGYAHPELLATTDWLAGHLHDPGLRVVDMDRPDAYPRTHIPGAVAVADHYFKGGVDRIHVQDPNEFAAEMSALGIGNDTTVVAYDSEGGHYAARLFWALSYYGHPSVKVLDGGFPKWFAEGRPLERDAPTYAAARFSPSTVKHCIAGKSDVLEASDQRETVFWDVRTDDEWTGRNSRGTARGGHIPGAVYLEWKNLVTDGDVPTIKPADELRAMLADVGITPGKNVVTY